MFNVVSIDKMEKLLPMLAQNRLTSTSCLWEATTQAGLGAIWRRLIYGLPVSSSSLDFSVRSNSSSWLRIFSHFLPAFCHVEHWISFVHWLIHPPLEILDRKQQLVLSSFALYVLCCPALLAWNDEIFPVLEFPCGFETTAWAFPLNKYCRRRNRPFLNSFPSK